MDSIRYYQQNFFNLLEKTKTFPLRGVDQIPDHNHVLINDQYMVMGDTKGQLIVLDSDLKLLYKQKKVNFLQMRFFSKDFLVTQSSHSVAIRDLKNQANLLHTIKLYHSLDGIDCNFDTIACNSKNGVFVIQFPQKHEEEKAAPENSKFTLSKFVPPS
jgi:hypothetical protein